MLISLQEVPNLSDVSSIVSPKLFKESLASSASSSIPLSVASQPKNDLTPSHSFMIPSYSQPHFSFSQSIILDHQLKWSPTFLMIATRATTAAIINVIGDVNTANAVFNNHVPAVVKPVAIVVAFKDVIHVVKLVHALTTASLTVVHIATPHVLIAVRLFVKAVLIFPKIVVIFVFKVVK